MIFLSDTSTERCFVMLCEEGEMRASLDLNLGLQHGSTYQVAVETLLDLAGLKPEEIEAWACITGPGSFTGLRMAVAATKVYAYLYDRPCIAIDAMEARAVTLLQGARRNGEKFLALPLLDARNERCWSGLYQYCASGVAAPAVLRAVQADPVAELLEEVAARHPDTDHLAVGGIKVPAATRAHLERLFPARWSLTGGGLKAEDLALLAEEKLRRGELVSAEAFKVSYFSLSQAEREWRRREGEVAELPGSELRCDV